MRMEALQAREDLMKSIQNFLKKFNRISFRETPKVLIQAWDKFFEVKHAQPEDVQELLNKLLQDLQSINEELADFINTPNWNRPAFCNNDDDDDEEYTIAITPVLPTEKPDNSLSMGDEHLSTIPEMESDEVIKSSVENLVQNPSESEDECECDVPDCDDSQTTNFSTFSNPLFDDSTSCNDESSHEEIDSPLEEFADELALLKSISPEFEDSNPEGDIRLVERRFQPLMWCKYPRCTPIILPPIPPCHMDFDFIFLLIMVSDHDLDVSSPSGDGNSFTIGVYALEGRITEISCYSFST
ncbi:hypothetical protein Tco_0552084 [Tanacetum coccineum]